MLIDRSILVLLLLAMIGQMASAIFLPSLPLIADSLGISSTTVQLLSSFYLIAYAGAHLLGGFFCDRFGRKKIIYWGIVFVITGSLITIAGTLNSLYSGRFLQAFGFGLSAIATKALMRDRYDGREYAVALSYMLNLALIAPACAPLIGAWLTLNYGWIAQFIAVAFATIALSIVVFFALRKERTYTPQQNNIFTQSWLLVRNGRFIGISFVSGLVFASDMSIELLAPFFLRNEFRASTEDCAYFFALSLIAILTGSSLIRFLKKDIEIISYYGSILMSLSVIILIASNNIYSIILGFVLYLISCGILYSTLSAIAVLPYVSNAGMAASISGTIHMGVAGFGSSFATWFLPSLNNLRIILVFVALLVFLFNKFFIVLKEPKFAPTQRA